MKNWSSTLSLQSLVVMIGPSYINNLCKAVLYLWVLYGSHRKQWLLP
jgi:hypothetical protein